MITCVLLVLGACDESSADGDQLGVGRLDGEVTAFFVGCPNEDIRGVRLYRLDDSPIAGDDGDELLFESTTATEADLLEGVPMVLVDELLPDASYFLEVTTSKQSPWVEFAVAELPTDGVIVGGQDVSIQEYLERAGEEFC